MKKNLILALFTIVAILIFGCRKEEETGSIYGTVTDFATGEPVKNVNVTLRPNGTTIQTGSDGTYTFQELKHGQYSLFLSKAEYEDLTVNDIELDAGQIISRDVQMKKMSAVMRVVDNERNEISELDFGEDDDDVSRLFNIFNDSYSPISWEITTTANWIHQVSETRGTLLAGETKGIIVVIDRDLLQQGENTTTMHITSNNGNKQLTIKAIRVDISTLDATSVVANSAVLNGKIRRNIPYTEKGFVYGENHSCANRVTVDGTGIGSYSCQISSLTVGTTYYFKAYCVNNGAIVYGEEKNFSFIPTFEYDGHTYMVAPDPGNAMTRSVADAYCEGLSLYGYSDWRLPTIEELLQMYAEKSNIGGFSDVGYWGSDYNAYWLFYVDFYNGTVESAYNGYNPEYKFVRPVRVEN